MADPKDYRPDPRPSSIRNTLVSYLTPIAQASAPFISTFTMIHLAAPIMANVGGSSLSSQVMVRTNHPELSERNDVLPGARHVASGKGILPNFIRRALLGHPSYRRTHTQCNPQAPHISSPTTSQDKSSRHDGIFLGSALHPTLLPSPSLSFIACTPNQRPFPLRTRLRIRQDRSPRLAHS